MWRYIYFIQTSISLVHNNINHFNLINLKGLTKVQLIKFEGPTKVISYNFLDFSLPKISMVLRFPFIIKGTFTCLINKLKLYYNYLSNHQNWLYNTCVYPLVNFINCNHLLWNHIYIKNKVVVRVKFLGITTTHDLNQNYKFLISYTKSE
jgi:hypothetical protein